MATQWPVVYARLLTLLPALPGWAEVDVRDGPGVDAQVLDYCTVGHAYEERSAGTFSHERHGNGFQVEETGSIRCELVTSSGDTDPQAVRVSAFALIDELEEAIRADQTLGVLSKGSTTALVVDVAPRQSRAGASQRLPFTVNYFTRS